MRIHWLKTNRQCMKDIKSGRKRFEVRINDRDYLVGDVLALRVYDIEKDTYHGHPFFVRVLYIIQGEYGLPKNLCVMSIEIPGYEDTLYITRKAEEAGDSSITL